METSQSNRSLNVDQKRIDEFMNAAVSHTEDKVQRMLRETPELINAKDECGDTALMKASRAGYRCIAQCLVANGADINAEDADGITPLMWASRNGHSSIVKCLLNKGADINARNEDVITPLMWASKNGHSSTVKCLLVNGADVNAKDQNGETALKWASGKGHVTISRYLLQHGADINAKNKDGWTALMMASSEGHDAIIQLLLDKGADESAKNENGETALDLANNIDIRRLIEEALQQRTRAATASPTASGTAIIASPDSASAVPPSAPSTVTAFRIIKARDVAISKHRLSSTDFSSVYRGEYKKTNVAIKMLRGDGGDLQMQEIEILSNLRHPRILSLLGVITDLEDRYGAVAGLVTEFMPQGSLYNVLHLDTTPPEYRLSTLSSKLRVLRDVADGMRFLHLSNVIHRDLKSPNVLLDDGRAKIGDFGGSQLLSTNATHATVRGAGTPAWQSPESFLQEAHVVRYSCDVYSFGVILWEMLTNRIPWNGVNPFQIAARILRGESLPLTAAASDPVTPPELIDLLARCLDMNADNRPTFDTILRCISELLPACIAREGRVPCPNAYMCPVSYEIMEDPVICSDGHTYDRVNIERWLQHHDTSPLTNVNLADHTLRPNIVLRGMIQEFKSAN